MSNQTYILQTKAAWNKEQQNLKKQQWIEYNTINFPHSQISFLFHLKNIKHHEDNKSCNVSFSNDKHHGW